MPRDSNVAAVVALLKNMSGLGGISPTPIPDNAPMPYITVKQIRWDKLQTFSGSSGVGPAIMQVDCYDKDYEAADAIRRAAGLILDAPALSSSGVTIQGSNHFADHDLYDDDRQLHQCITRYRIWFEV